MYQICLLLFTELNGRSTIFIRSSISFFFPDVNEESQEALSNITEGVCHPLQVRVEQIFSSNTVLTSLYCAINFLRFYEQTFNQVNH